MKPVDCKIDFLLKTIDSFGPDEKTIFVLEEVTKSTAQYIRENMKGFGFIYSLNLRERGRYEGKNRELGIMIGFSSTLVLNSYNLLERTLFPERTLHANFSCDNYKIGVIGFHSLTGVGYKQAKSAQFASTAEYMHQNETDIDFLCFDANEPEVDHHNISDIKFFRDGANLILGKEKIHKLEDAYREFLSKKPALLKEKIEIQNISENIASNPLETSYVIRGNYKKRYDYIFVSSKWDVINVEYRLEGAIEAGGDHAIVIGEFEAKV